jgi:hypothetical protein
MTRGYKYSLEALAQAAVNACNDYYGYPRPGSVTAAWTKYLADPAGFWYIRYDPSLVPVLGEPTEFETTP